MVASGFLLSCLGAPSPRRPHYWFPLHLHTKPSASPLHRRGLSCSPPLPPPVDPSVLAAGRASRRLPPHPELSTIIGRLCPSGHRVWLRRPAPSPANPYR